MNSDLESLIRLQHTETARTTMLEKRARFTYALRSLRPHAHPLSVLFAFLLEQYRLSDGRADVGVRSGDLVIDAGAGGGATALYFVHRLGQPAQLCHSSSHRECSVVRPKCVGES